MGKPIVPSASHPLVVKFANLENKKETLTYDFRESKVLIKAAIHGHIEGKVVDPATEELRANKPNVWVPLVRPELHEIKGHITLDALFEYKNKEIKFLSGEIRTTKGPQEAIFSTGTECQIDGGKYVFNGNQWK